MMTTLGTVILAAGKGTRMHSDQPKVLLPLLGEPMLSYVIDAVDSFSATHLWTVIGHGAEQIEQQFGGRNSRFIVQAEQLGTGHALQCAFPAILASGVSYVLVVNGDTPLVDCPTLESFADTSMAQDADVAFITLTPDNAASFGRVIRCEGDVVAIVEAKDYDESIHGPASNEINAGIYCLRVAALEKLLPKLQNGNKSGEYYITDLVELAVADGLCVLGLEAGDNMNLLGVNTPLELASAEELLRKRIVRRWLERGAHISAAAQVRIGPFATLEPGCKITGPCEVYGTTHIHKGAQVDSHCYIESTQLAAGAVVRSFCHLVEASIGVSCVVGPFARMRPGAVMEEGAHLGSFVEMKKSRLGKGSKANHLSYIGDADIGEGVNIGAGVITCNYDGKNKFKTIIGDNAFVGSNVSLVAPVVIGPEAFVGAGSVITKDVPEKHLGISRARQANLLRKFKPE